jgi:hypothetical protein
MKILSLTMAALSTSVIATGIGCLVSLLEGSEAGSALAQAGSAQAQLVDAAGNMHIPNNYRTNYEYLGSWSVAGDEKGAKEMHTVYASPGAAEAYRATGKFPDGSVLVKEVQSTATAVMTTGTVSHVDRLKGWFMMVKDSKNSHPDNKLWGNGWGWSWFDADNKVKTTSKDFRADCLGCHIPAKATDWIYVSGYPGLKK